MNNDTTAAVGSLEVKKEMEVNAAPATVWKMIGDFNHLDVWHPAVVASAVSGPDNEPGAVRTLTLVDGATITEELKAHSDDDMSYSYAITESPLPVSDYVSTISVAAGKDGKSMVFWSSTFDASGAEGANAIDVITGIYDGGLGSLAKHFAN